MAVFTVHVRDTPDQVDLVLVKTGFSWAAAFFGFAWALSIGAWSLAFALLVLQIVVGTSLPLIVADPLIQVIVQISFAVILGMVANECRRIYLNVKGLTETDCVSGENKEQAARRYLDRNPNLTAKLLGY